MSTETSSSDDNRSHENNGARIRAVLRKLFPKCAWVGDLKAVRIFFTALLCGRFEKRLKTARRRVTLPYLRDSEIRRELIFLKNLSMEEVVDGHPTTLWRMYETARSSVWRNSPPMEAIAKKNVAAFDYRVAQYLYIIRNARKAVD